MADPSETWSQRFEREAEAAWALVRRRPVLGLVFACAMIFFGWNQFFKSKDIVPSPSFTRSIEPKPALTRKTEEEQQAAKKETAKRSETATDRRSQAAAEQHSLPQRTTPRIQNWTIQGSTAVDYRTGLTWQRCAVGLRYSDGACNGKAAQLKWAQALEAQYDNWRLPSKDELLSLYEWKGKDNRPINQQVFPNFDCCWYWTSTIVNTSGGDEFGWIGIFYAQGPSVLPDDTVDHSTAHAMASSTNGNLIKGAGVLLVRSTR